MDRGVFSTGFHSHVERERRQATWTWHGRRAKRRFARRGTSHVRVEGAGADEPHDAGGTGHRRAPVGSCDAHVRLRKEGRRCVGRGSEEEESSREDRLPLESNFKKSTHVDDWSRSSTKQTRLRPTATCEKAHRRLARGKRTKHRDVVTNRRIRKRGRKGTSHEHVACRLIDMEHPSRKARSSVGGTTKVLVLEDILTRVCCFASPMQCSD